MSGKMKGIDVSKWQGNAGFSPAKMEADFIICKATQGVRIIDPTVMRMANETLNCGKLLGLYHFADGLKNVTAQAEADYFLKAASPFIGKAILVLDWEGDAMSKGIPYAKAFCDRVYSQTGIIPVIYTGTFYASRLNWKDFIASFPYLWGAEYNKNPVCHGYTENPVKKPLSLGGFTEVIRQYSSNTYLDGFPNRLDVNEAYIDKNQWQKLCKKSSGPSPAPTPTPTPTLSVDEIAFKIANGEGEWKGVNGPARKTKLESMGYNYRQVQDKINKIIKDRQAGIEWYIVKKGDTLSGIAKKNGISLAQIKELNKDNIKNFNVISVGQWVRIK